MSTGGKTYAVPSVLVEQVQQLRANALAAAYNEGAVMWQGNRVPMHYLSTLLGDTGAAPPGAGSLALRPPPETPGRARGFAAKYASLAVPAGFRIAAAASYDAVMVCGSQRQMRLSK